MPQGAMPFQYVQEKGSTGMTALAGLGRTWTCGRLPVYPSRSGGIWASKGAGLDRGADGDLPGAVEPGGR